MRREDRFVMSHKPFAVDLSSLREEHDFSYVDAVWFRRRRGVAVACIGNLHAILHPAPSTALEFCERHTDGRHSGDCQGRWDGTGYWDAEQPSVAAKHLAILRPMLDDYAHDPKNPVIPAGYDGWYVFPRGGSANA
jgi:hypothetical protein